MRNLKSQIEEGSQSLKAQQDDNSHLISKISNLEESLKNLVEKSAKKESALAEKLHRVETEKQEIEDKLRNASAQLNALLSKSPEVCIILYNVLWISTHSSLAVSFLVTVVDVNPLKYLFFFF